MGIIIIVLIISLLIFALSYIFFKKISYSIIISLLFIISISIILTNSIFFIKSYYLNNNLNLNILYHSKNNDYVGVSVIFNKGIIYSNTINYVIYKNIIENNKNIYVILPEETIKHLYTKEKLNLKNTIANVDVTLDKNELIKIIDDDYIKKFDYTLNNNLTYREIITLNVFNNILKNPEFINYLLNEYKKGNIMLIPEKFLLKYFKKEINFEKLKIKVI